MAKKASSWITGSSIPVTSTTHIILIVTRIFNSGCLVIVTEGQIRDEHLNWWVGRLNMGRRMKQVRRIRKGGIIWVLYILWFHSMFPAPNDWLLDLCLENCDITMCKVDGRGVDHHML
jgi:energy-converting hydrogenase Eha subunit G